MFLFRFSHNTAIKRSNHLSNFGSAPYSCFSCSLYAFAITSRLSRQCSRTAFGCGLLPPTGAMERGMTCLAAALSSGALTARLLTASLFLDDLRSNRSHARTAAHSLRRCRQPYWHESRCSPFSNQASRLLDDLHLRVPRYPPAGLFSAPFPLSSLFFGVWGLQQGE